MSMGTGETFHVLEQVPPDYYDIGTGGNRFQRLWHGRKWQMLRELLTADPSFSPSQILDVGCAGGLTTSHIGGWFPQASATGLDAYREAVVYADQHRERVRFVLGDAHQLPFASERFDVITCVETLEHLVEPRKTVQEVYRCLRPGALAVVVQDTDSLLFRSVWWVWTKSRGQVWDHAHVNPLNAQGLQRLMEEVGFRIEKKRFTFFGMEVFLLGRKPG